MKTWTVPAAGGMRKIVHLGEILEGLWRAIPMHEWHLDGLFLLGVRMSWVSKQPELIGSLKLGIVWIFVQLIHRPAKTKNQLYKKLKHCLT